MFPFLETLDALAAALAEPPDPLAFRAVCALLDTCSGDDQEEAITFAERTLAGWPDEVRVAPWSWLCAAVAGADKRTWRLVRTLETSSGRCDCEDVPLDQLAALRKWDHVSRLNTSGYAGLDGPDDGETITTTADRWPALRHIGRVRPYQAADLERFLGSPVLDRLESLDLGLPYRASEPLSWPRPLPKLRRLRLTLQHDSRAAGLLDPDLLPNLSDLELCNEQYHAARHDNLDPLVAAAGVMPRLTGLTLFAFPSAWLAALFDRCTWNLDQLALTNRAYIPPNLVEHQQQACRLDTQAIEAAVRSGVCRTLSQLTVTHNRIGTEVLKLVEATTPGRLQCLELVDVDLNDQDAERLANLPQLSGLTRLDIRSNPLTGRGLAALARKGQLANLRHLQAGGEWYNPYYGGYIRQPQPLGDEGFAALVGAPWFRQLETLAVVDAGVGPAGLEALARTTGPLVLRELDLSLNSLGSAGARALAGGPVVSAMRRLALAACALDDEAAGYLASAGFTRLRSLLLPYNSLGVAGVRALAGSPALAGLWELDLADNVFEDEGLVALADSPHLRQLVELVTEKDVWNYHRGRRFGTATAAAFARSPAFARLDAFFGGVMDGYHGNRPWHAFTAEGIELIRRAAGLRPEVRQGIAAMQEDPPSEPEEGDNASQPRYTPEQLQEMRQRHDFRTRDRE